MPITLTANGLPVLGAEIVEPRYGVWTADLTVDVETARELTGRVTIATEDGQVSFTGTAFRGGEFASQVQVRVVAGSGGLATVTGPKFYRSQPLRVAIADVLDLVGETLSGESSAEVLAKTLTTWSRLSGTASHSLTRLVEQAPGATWRFLRDGTVFVGMDTFPEVVADYERLDEDAGDGTAILIGEAPTLRPGVTFLGRRVSDVVHSYTEDETRTIVYFEDEKSVREPGGRGARALLGIVRAATQGTEYLALRLGTVIRQAEERGSPENRPLEVRFLDDRGVPDQVAVPLLQGIHGVTQRVARGARVLLGFLSGSGQKPFALGWQDGTPTHTTIDAATKIRMGAEATRGAARLADEVNAGTLTFTFTTNPAPLTTLTYTPAGGVPGLPQTLPLTPTGDATVSVDLLGKIISASTLVDIE